MKKLTLLNLVFISFMITGCSILNKSEHIYDPHAMDRRYELGSFTDLIFGQGYGFDGVGNFTSTYKFSCENKKNPRIYTVTLMSENHKKAEKFSTKIRSLTNSGKQLKHEQLAKINEDLQGSHLVGPVGLHCGRPGQEEYPFLLILNTAYRSKYSPYSYRNFKYLFTDKDFS